MGLAGFWEVRVGRGHDILPLPPTPTPTPTPNPYQARAQWGVVTTECRALASLACTYMCARYLACISPRSPICLAYISPALRARTALYPWPEPNHP